MSRCRFLLSLFLSLGMPVMTQAESGTTELVSYTDPMTEHDSVMLGVDKKGAVFAFTSYSRPGMALRALGSYQLVVGADDPALRALADATHAIKASGRAPAPLPMGRLAATIYLPDGEKVFSVPKDAPPSPVERRFQEAAEQVIQRAATAPRAAIAMAARLGASEARRGDELMVTLTFKNPGKLAAHVPSPALAGKPPWKVLRLAFWKPVTVGSESTFAFETAVDLDGEFLAGERKSVGAEPRLITVAPGASLAVSTRFRVPRLAPGTYQVEAYFVLARPPGDRDAELFGEYHADPVPLVVARSGLF
jgi:hypothetical protein